MAELPSWVVNPFNDQQSIFLLFNSVRILKCIRNNWLNLKNCKKTFIFPDIADNNKVLYASFAELESIYLKEAKYKLKKAPTLSWKALHPHSLERQNVKLALKIFADTTVAALKSYGPESENMENWNGTSHFISLIWCIVNVKHPYKGRNTLNKYACPVDAADHENVQFFSSMGTC